MYINAVSWIFTVFTYILLCHHGLINIISVHGSYSRISAPYYIGDIAINCGCTGNSTGLDGREWIGEAASKLMSGKSRSSTAAESSFSGADPVPYMTSRISETSFHYTFQVKPGQKFIRMHFYPASYRGFEKSMDLFNVKAGPFTLLRDFSASRTCDQLGVKYFVKEFCVNVEENRKLNITFSPSLSRKSKTNTYAFVNGIEVISMPPGLYYSPDGDVGAPIVGQHNRFYSIDNSTALELIQRLNIGGSSISPIEDFGMFRRWNEDADYLLEPRVHRASHPGDWIKFSNMPSFIAPPKLYQTSWITEGSARTNSIYKVTWKIPLDLGFGYLVRLHFCDFSAGMTENRKKEFVVFINNHIAETKANVFKWSGGKDIPVYRDYVVIVKGDEEGRTSDLLISLESIDGLVSGLLNGLEIFKLSNPDNSLATPNPVFPEWVSTSWNQKIQNLFSAVGSHSINVISTVVTFIIIGVSTIVYKLRETREESIDGEKDGQSSSNESSCRIFSLAEIVLATQNFSDALFIGKGGFGKVYKGSINGISEAVAIKRLNSNSRQGAHEFWTEIETLSNLRHVHLVSLIGYCNEYKEMILVYQNMSRGTLADNLYKAGRDGTNCVPLSWEQRLRICIGAARGLDYLHTGSECGVIHRDVKDTNILLDDNLVAKISDFGLSKLEKLTQSRSYVSTKVKGTFGYLDPDYFMTQNLTRKTDVYAFGVVLLVALCGRPAVDNRNPEEPQSLLSCFRECIAEGGVDRIVDPSLQGKISPDSLEEFVKSVKNCLLHQPKKRPTMAQVVASLEHALEQHKNITPFVPNDASVVESFKFVLAPKIELQEEDIHDHATEIHNEEHIIQSQAAQIHQESVISQQNKDAISSKHYQNSAFPISRGKPLWGWPWKESWSRGKALAMKKTELVSSSESDLVPTSDCGPRFSIEDIREATDSFIDVGPGTLEKITDSGPLINSNPRLNGITVDKYVEFSYEELAEATDDFSLANKIGQGGFGSVFYGELRGEVELAEATDDFSLANKIGQGGFGSVFYGELRGEKAAIKKMDMQASKEFLAELKVLTHVHHLNLVRLIGYCVEGSLFLVYEYIENGNLTQHLRGSGGEPLSWSTRVQIALDSARGLEYIHEHTVPVYIHRDIKSANILIDKNFRAKVADFGLTKLTEVGSTSLHTRLVGTFGYMPPEYAQYGDVSSKVDVYAFGVVLYELISAKEAIIKPNEVVTESWGLVGLFEDADNKPDPQEALIKLFDPRLPDDYPLDSVRKMAQLARVCVHENPQLRPSMRSIVVALMTLSSTTEDWDIGSFYENQGLVHLMSGR